MLISQSFGTEVRVTVDTKVLNQGTFVFPKITTNYVKKQIAPIYTTWTFPVKTRAITTTKTYPVKVIKVIVNTDGDQYPIKKLKQYNNFPKKSLARVVTQNNMSVTTVFVPTTTTVLTKYPLGSFTTISNTQVPVTYYNATGTFWSTS